jgi:TFIIF-interacting CTD phosphatase-like protein
MLPPLHIAAEKKPLTLFMEIDDVFLNTFLCDENFGYMANPSAKDPEHEFFLAETRQPVLVYERDHLQDLLGFLKSSKKDGIETIVYSTGTKFYIDRLVEILDPRREVFDHILYQNACYVFEKEDEDIHLLVKDISRF